MTPGSHEDAESLEFLRFRVAKFGLFSGFFVFLFWAYRMASGDLPLSADSLAHVAAALLLLLVWPVLSLAPRTARVIRGVESVALCGSSALLIVMGMSIQGVLARPELIILLALTFVSCSRAVYVPSSGRRTAVLCGVIGVALLTGVYLSYEHIDLRPIAAIYPEIAGTTSRQLAVGITINTGMWWALSSGLAFATSRVIYGLRQEARAIRQLGQYQLDRKIGAGGMGIVYEAHHAMLRRPTAVKLLPPDKTGQSALERFEREVKLTARLRHPNTVTIYDYGRTPDGIFYYAMELLEGATLEQVVEAGGALPPARVGHILMQVAGALSEAHGLGLIHRDIKPANIMLCNQGGLMDVVKVLDFGLVKDISPPETDPERALFATHTDAITGTPLYMSPEAVSQPSSLDARSDLYALGAVGYYLLVGRHVFEGASVVEVCSHHLLTAPVPPSKRLGRELPERLEALVLACLEKSQGNRPASAAELAERLREAGLGPWDNADARAWWSSHRIESALSRPSKAAGSHTIMVDLARRTP
jgi:eukaryotic-like serine/threonine-protein kinase